MRSLKRLRTIQGFLEADCIVAGHSALCLDETKLVSKRICVRQPAWLFHASLPGYATNVELQIRLDCECAYKTEIYDGNILWAASHRL